jgi:hypothetical protein
MLNKNPSAAKAQKLTRKRSAVRKGVSAPLPSSQGPISSLKIESRFLPIAPGGDGYMPLSAALHWIASKGLTCAPDTCLDANAQYQAAAKEFKAKASSGKVRVVGADHNRTVETFPSDQFATTQWCFVFNEADLFSEILANEARIVIMPCGENEQSEDQFWVGGNQPRLAMLQVSRKDVRREWPFKRYCEIPPPQLKRGHRKGERWLHADVPLFQEMGRLLETSQAKDIKSAAMQVQERAVTQGGSPESVAKRLARSYTHWTEAQHKQ